MMIENLIDRALFKRHIFQRALIIGAFLCVLFLVQPGTSAVYPSFYGMNQANMTLVEYDGYSHDNIAYGDFLYLFDTSTADGGDVITAVDDTEIDGIEALRQTLQNYEPGDEVTLSIIRDQKTITVDVTLSSHP